jgi:hypothetical protein
MLRRCVPDPATQMWRWVKFSRDKSSLLAKRLIPP